MKQRGKILRDTSAGPGLVMIGSRQHPFDLEGVWQSSQAPAVNMTVEALLDDAGNVVTLSVVAESQLAREAADEAMAAVKQKGNALVARFGPRTLGAMALLAIGWFMLNVVSVQVSADYRVGISFWKLLGLINSPGGVINAMGGNGGSAGMYGLVAVLAIVAPLAPYFVKDRRAHLANLLPLIFMVAIGIAIYLNISDGLSQAKTAASYFGGRDAGRMASDFASQMVREALKAISLGLGAYLSLIVSVYLAGTGLRGFLAGR
ncbi:hypothetical protein [Pandoraea norimbergensis]|uniref:Uncharacterized protein n=1 Tax=Pandoraea norimbergensis TaxID=93219 RepID=A0ABN4JK82_9BURK|nr:hypothetical protein [Pandoraea norimbergensis]ALS60416.1 hypothetical protein AT302_12160 [Pandoraea norimbergensis]